MIQISRQSKHSFLSHILKTSLGEGRLFDTKTLLATQRHQHSVELVVIHTRPMETYILRLIRYIVSACIVWYINHHPSSLTIHITQLQHHPAYPHLPLQRSCPIGITMKIFALSTFFSLLAMMPMAFAEYSKPAPSSPAGYGTTSKLPAPTSTPQPVPSAPAYVTSSKIAEPTRTPQPAPSTPAGYATTSKIPAPIRTPKAFPSTFVSVTTSKVPTPTPTLVPYAAAATITPDEWV